MEVEVLCVFSKGPTTIEIRQKLPKDSNIFYEKERDQEDHQGQIGEEARGTQTRSLWTKFYILFFFRIVTCELQNLKKSKLFILRERGNIRKIIKRTNWQGGETQTRSQASSIPFLHILTTLCSDDIVSFFTNSTTWSEMS